MGNLSPVAVLADSAGNLIKSVQDGADYLLGVATKLRNVAGSIINPATEDTLATLATEAKLEAVRSLVNSIDGKDFSTETTLAQAATDLAAIETLLTAIRDTAGIKKITDPLPPGTNNIGDVDVVSSALPAGAATEATLAAIRDTAGIKKITDALPAGTNLLGKSTISQGGNDASVNASNQLLVEAVLAAGGASQTVKITDNSEMYIVGVTTDGRLKVEQALPTAPPATTAVEDFEVGTISSGNYQNYSIPVGETLVIQQFVAGCAGEGGKGARVTLIYDQGGGEPIQNLEIARLYVQASTAVFPVEFTAPRAAQSGDRIRIYRFPLEGSTQEVYGYWRGYY